MSRAKATGGGSAGSAPAGQLRADAVRNRRAIAETAMRVLAEHPGTSMGQIADASGLGRATLYRHFATRDELVQAIQAQAVEAAAEALVAAELDKGNAAEALRRAIRALVGVGDRYRLLAHETAIDTRMMQRQPEVAGRLVALVLRGQKSGELRSDLPPEWIIPALANLLVMALRTLAEQEISHEQVAERVASTLLDGIASRTPGQAPAGGPRRGRST